MFILNPQISPTILKHSLAKAFSYLCASGFWCLELCLTRRDHARARASQPKRFCPVVMGIESIACRYNVFTARLSCIRSAQVGFPFGLFLTAPLKGSDISVTAMFQEIRVNPSGVPYSIDFWDSSFSHIPQSAGEPYTSTDDGLRSPSLSSLTELALTRLEPHSPPSSSSSFSDLLLSPSTSLPLLKDADKGTSHFHNRFLSQPFSLRSAPSLLKRKPRRASENDLLCTPPAHPCSSIDVGNIRSSWIVIPSHNEPKPLPPPPHTSSTEPNVPVAGLFIQFRAHSEEPESHPKRRLLRLQKTIGSAVLAAGMETPSTGTDPTNLRPQAMKDSCPAALFRGTYGQMTTALENAGLSATPCHGCGISGGQYNISMLLWSLCSICEPDR